MDRKVFLRRALFLPVLVLAVIPPGWIVLAFAGPPYLIFATIAFFTSRGFSEHTLSRLSLIAPLIYFPFLMAYWHIFFMRKYPDVELFETYSILFLYTVVLGYGFVGIVHAVVAWIKRNSNKRMNTFTSFSGMPYSTFI